MKITFGPLFAAMALAVCVTQANATVYNVNGVVGTGGVTGFIQTDGTIGTLADANIVDWNLSLTTDGINALDLLGPLSGNNSQELIVGAGLSATASGLFFDFSLPGATNYLLIQNPAIGSGTNFLCLNACAASVAIGVGDERASVSNLTGVRDIGVVPLPATLPLLTTGLGALGLLGRSWKRKHPGGRLSRTGARPGGPKGASAVRPGRWVHQ